MSVNGSYMVTKSKTKDSAEEEAALPVSPSQTRNKRGQDEPEDHQEWKVPLMLPFDQRILSEVSNIRRASLQVGFKQHPPNVGP